MSEMVERVAKVLWEHISECYVKIGAPALPDFDDEFKAGLFGKENALEAARRAIAAMRDPPEKVIGQFFLAYEHEWNNAIDEALK